MGANLANAPEDAEAMRLFEQALRLLREAQQSLDALQRGI
jgi:hypothetical protein